MPFRKCIGRSNEHLELWRCEKHGVWGNTQPRTSVRAFTAKQGGEGMGEAGLWIPLWQDRLHKGGTRLCCLINHDKEHAQREPGFQHSN